MRRLLCTRSEAATREAYQRIRLIAQWQPGGWEKIVSLDALRLQPPIQQLAARCPVRELAIPAQSGNATFAAESNSRMTNVIETSKQWLVGKTTNEQHHDNAKK